MAHEHAIRDLDKRFVIDTATKIISTTENNIPVFSQYDHNSEHITFEVDRFAEGHDLSVCDKVEVHYNNIDSSGRNASRGLYEATDLAVDPSDNTKVTFTWVVSEMATQHAGRLNFVVSFVCTDDGDLLYRWNTKVNSDITISNGINNSEAVEKTYADVLEMWKLDLFGIGDTEEARMMTISQNQQNAIEAAGKEVGKLTEEYKAALVEKANQLLATIPDEYEELQNTVNELIEGQYIPKTTIDGNTITETYNDGRKRITTIEEDVVTERWYTASGVLTKTNVITISQNGVIENMTTV